MVDNAETSVKRLRRTSAGGSADEPASASRIGIDIGGSGIKGGRVDLATGALLGDRTRIDTPSRSSPRSVAQAVATVVDLVGGDGPIGITFPGIVRGGVIGSAANLRRSWLGTDAAALFADRLMRDVVILNDADAAGIAEMRFGAGRGKGGVVVVVTLGTGIGGGIVRKGELFSGDTNSAAEIWLMRNKLSPEMNVEEGACIRAVRRVYAKMAGIAFEQSPDPRGIEQIALGTAEGNAGAARESYRRLGEVVGDTIGNALTLVDGLVVIGGGVSKGWRLFWPALMEELNSQYTGPNGNSYRRLNQTVFNLEDSSQLDKFLQSDTRALEP